MVLSTLGLFFFFKRDTYVRVIFFLSFFFYIRAEILGATRHRCSGGYVFVTQKPCREDFPILLLHQLDHIFILQHVILAHFLGVVFDGRAPHECTERGRHLKLTKKVQQDACLLFYVLTFWFFSTAALDPQGATTPLKPSHHVCTSLTHSVPRGRVTLYGINMSTDWWSPIWRWWSLTSSQIWGDGCDYSWRVVLNQQRTSCKLTLHKSTKPD